MNTEKIRHVIFDTIDDLARNFCYYDRREDQELNIKTFDYAVDNSVVTLREMVKRFESALEREIAGRAGYN